MQTLTRARTPRFVQLDTVPAGESAQEIRVGLMQARASIAPKYFYDALGSHLFAAITELAEYYPTRVEAAIMAAHLPAMAECIGLPAATLIDLGAGNCRKAARLFAALEPAAYVALDISVDFLRDAIECLQREHPAMAMTGVGIDFTRSLALPPDVDGARRLFFYPGSSIGNFTPEEAVAFLARVREAIRDRGALVIGVDLVKDKATLERAYDDALGVTAAFNLNVLQHVNRLAGADFAVADWRHVALFDTQASRIEMHLEAKKPLVVRGPGLERRFAAGERIHTENSYKYTLASFAALLARAGFVPAAHWTDPREWFGVFLARPA